MKKRFSAVLLTLILILCLSVQAFAGTTYTEGTLNYTLNDNSITITGCFGKDETVTVPNAIAGYPVNAIAAGAFSNNSYVKAVNLPDTITSIENGAFASGIAVKFNSNITGGNNDSKPDSNQGNSGDNQNPGTTGGNDNQGTTGGNNNQGATDGNDNQGTAGDNGQTQQPNGGNGTTTSTTTEDGTKVDTTVYPNGTKVEVATKPDGTKTTTTTEPSGKVSTIVVDKEGNVLSTMVVDGDVSFEEADVFLDDEEFDDLSADIEEAQMESSHGNFPVKAVSVIVVIALIAVAVTVIVRRNKKN